MGMYGLQMLAVPAKMVTDHFDAPATPLLQFWIRGSSCAFLTIVYLVKFKLATEDAVPVALAMSVACGALYPWNAKFGYLSPGLPTKYPMHYVPEVHMAVRRGVQIFSLLLHLTPRLRPIAVSMRDAASRVAGLGIAP